MTDNPVELAEEAVALRLIADALYARSKDLSGRAAAAMGRGTLYPKLPDGTELACFNVPDDSTVVVVDEDRLLPWVREFYPTELMESIRPAFINRIKEVTKKHGWASGPGGEVDIPGVTLGTEPSKGPRITAKAAGKERAQSAVDAVLSDALGSFARPQIEGDK